MQPTTNLVRADKNHFEYLDALRGLAILSVIMVHSSLLTGQKGMAATIGFTGQRGVQLFYIMSAFTLCLSLDTRKDEHYPFSNYLLRRFFRVAPLFYLAICGNLALFQLAPRWNPNPHLGTFDFIAGFLFLNGTRPTAINSVAIGGWSIAVETTFYLLLPVLHRQLRNIGRASIWFALSSLTLGFLSWRLAVHSSDAIHEQYFAFLWFPVELPVFLLGILGYRVWQKYIRVALIDLKQRKELSLCLLLGSALTYQGCLPFRDQTLYSSSLLFLLLLLALSLYPWPLMVNSFTRFIGKISYSMYLVHFFVLMFSAWCLQQLNIYAPNFCAHHINGSLVGWVLAYLFILLLSIPICLLTWQFVEQPGMNLGRRLILRRERDFLNKLGQRRPADLLNQPVSENAQF